VGTRNSNETGIHEKMLQRGSKKGECDIGCISGNTTVPPRFWCNGCVTHENTERRVWNIFFVSVVQFGHLSSSVVL